MDELFFGISSKFADALNGLADASYLVANECETFGRFAQVDLGRMALGVAYHLHEIG